MRKTHESTHGQAHRSGVRGRAREPALGRQVSAGVPGSRRGCRAQGCTVHSSLVGPARPERSSPQSGLCARAPAAAVTLLRPLLSYRGSAARPLSAVCLARKVGLAAVGRGVTGASSLPGPTPFPASTRPEIRWGARTCLNWRERSGSHLAFARGGDWHDLDQLPFHSGPQFCCLFHKTAWIIHPIRVGRQPESPDSPRCGLT